MRKPPEATERRIGAWSDLGKARGGAGQWGSPASGCTSTSSASRAKLTSANDRGGRDDAHLGVGVAGDEA